VGHGLYAKRYFWSGGDRRWSQVWQRYPSGTIEQLFHRKSRRDNDPAVGNPLHHLVVEPGLGHYRKSQSVPHAHTDAGAYTDCDAEPDAQRNTGFFSDPYTHPGAYTDCDAEPNAQPNTNAYSGPHANTSSFSDTNPNGHTSSKCNADSKANSNARNLDFRANRRLTRVRHASRSV
jgi:hypothetical protein